MAPSEWKKHKALLLISLFIFAIPLKAVDLPLYLKWQSRDRLYYDKKQNNKQLSWDALSKAEIGFDELQYKDFSASLILKTKDVFQEKAIYLDELVLDWQKGNFSINGGSKERGYGSDYYSDDILLLKKGYEKYNYQPIRTEFVGIRHQKGHHSFSIELGGNCHNAKAALVNYKYKEDKNKLLVSNETRSFDSHHRTPVNISAFESSNKLLNDKLTLRNTFAISYFPNIKETKQHLEHYYQGEMRHDVGKSFSYGFGYSNLKREYAPFERQEIHYYNEYRIKDFILTEFIGINTLRPNIYSEIGLQLDWQLSPISKIGIYYEFGMLQKQNPRHSVGLCLDLMHFFDSDKLLQK